MTACNVILHSHAAHILTDGQASTAGKIVDGRKWCVSKVWVMPHLNAAMVISGPYLVGPVAHFELSHGCSSFEGLKRNAVALMKAVETDLDAVLALAPDRRIILTIAGIDGRGKADCFTVSNFMRDESGDGGTIDAWRVTHVFPVKVDPSSPGILSRVRAMFADGVDSYDDVDPVRDGIRIMEVQREDGAHHGVGGFIQLTTVSLAGITSRIIHRWHEDGVAHGQAA